MRYGYLWAALAAAILTASTYSIAQAQEPTIQNPPATTTQQNTQTNQQVPQPPVPASVAGQTSATVNQPQNTAPQNPVPNQNTPQVQGQVQTQVQGQTNVVTPAPGQVFVPGQIGVQTQTVVPNLQPGVAVGAEVSATIPDQARYRWVNGHWWYLMPSGQWMIWINNQWVGFDPATYGSNTYSQPTYSTSTTYVTPSYSYGSSYYTPSYGYGYSSPYYGGYGGYGLGGYGGYPGYGYGYGYPGYGYGGFYGGGVSPFFYRNPGGAVVGGNIGSAIGGQIGGGQGAAIGGGIGAAIGGNQHRH